MSHNDDEEFKSGFGVDTEEDAEDEFDLDDALLDEDGEAIDEDDEEGFEEEFADDDTSSAI